MLRVNVNPTAQICALRYMHTANSFIASGTMQSLLTVCPHTASTHLLSLTHSLTHLPCSLTHSLALTHSPCSLTCSHSLTRRAHLLQSSVKDQILNHQSNHHTATHTATHSDTHSNTCFGSNCAQLTYRALSRTWRYWMLRRMGMRIR